VRSFVHRPSSFLRKARYTAPFFFFFFPSGAGFHALPISPLASRGPPFFFLFFFLYVSGSRPSTRPALPLCFSPVGPHPQRQSSTFTTGGECPFPSIESEAVLRTTFFPPFLGSTSPTVGTPTTPGAKRSPFFISQRRENLSFLGRGARPSGVGMLVRRAAPSPPSKVGLEVIPLSFLPPLFPLQRKQSLHRLQREMILCFPFFRRRVDFQGFFFFPFPLTIPARSFFFPPFTLYPGPARPRPLFFSLFSLLPNKLVRGSRLFFFFERGDGLIHGFFFFSSRYYLALLFFFFFPFGGENKDLIVWQRNQGRSPFFLLSQTEITPLPSSPSAF